MGKQRDQLVEAMAKLVMDMRGVGAPREPTQAQVDDHMLTHLPPRSWCSICCAARGIAPPHRSGDQNQGEVTIPTVSMDYCYPGAPPGAEELMKKEAQRKQVNGEAAVDDPVPGGVTADAGTVRL